MGIPRLDLLPEYEAGKGNANAFIRSVIMKAQEDVLLWRNC